MNIMVLLSILMLVGIVILSVFILIYMFSSSMQLNKELDKAQKKNYELQKRNEQAENTEKQTSNEVKIKAEDLIVLLSASYGQGCWYTELAKENKEKFWLYDCCSISKSAYEVAKVLDKSNVDYEIESHKDVIHEIVKIGEDMKKTPIAKTKKVE